MMLFLKMFISCTVLLMLCALLCFYPFINHFRFSRRTTCAVTGGLLTVLGLFFAGVCCYLVSALPSEQIFPKADLAFLACLLPCVGWYIYAVQEIWQKKLYIFALTLTSGLAVTFVMNAMGVLLLPASATPPNPLPNLPQLCVITAVLVPLLWLLLKQFYMPVSDGLSRKESGYLSVLSLLLFAMLACGLIPVNYMARTQPQSFLLCGILLLTVFSIYFICFKMFRHAHESAAAQQSVARIQHQFEINNEQYKRIRDNIELSSRLRHDFHHHAIVLQGFLAANELGKAEEYLGQFTKMLEESAVASLCENPVVDAVASYYRTLANGREIVFTAHIKLPNEVAVQDSDLSVLLGNLLENAIAAADRASKEQRYVQLNILCSGKMLAITVDNGFDGGIKPEGGGYRSTKANHSGIGLKSIESVAEKYGGGVEFTHEPQVFHASVMLNMGQPSL